jgi:hypothetical protein
MIETNTSGRNTQQVYSVMEFEQSIVGFSVTYLLIRSASRLTLLANETNQLRPIFDFTQER